MLKVKIRGNRKLLNEKFDLKPIVKDVIDYSDELFQKTHATFSKESQPDKVYSIVVKGKTTTGKSGRAGTIYGWVNKGTKKHEISARPENPTGELVFRTGYNRKTQPGIIGSGESSYNGDKIVTPFPVEHPGATAANMHEAVQKETKQYIVNNKKKYIAMLKKLLLQ